METGTVRFFVHLFSTLSPPSYSSGTRDAFHYDGFGSGEFAEVQRI